jgi:hypothetical protein
MEEITMATAKGFTVDELAGYRKGERYQKHLEFVRMWGNSGNRHIVLMDEDGNELLWSTRDATKAYRKFRLKANWDFKVDHILNPDMEMNLPSVNISYLKLLD